MARKPSATEGQRKSGAVSAFLRALVFLLVLASIAVGGAYFYANSQMEAPGPVTENEAPRVVLIPDGASVSRMANILADVGAIDSPLRLRLAAKFRQVETVLKAGEYEIPSGASLQEILDILSNGRSLLHPVTIPEGLTSRAIIQRLRESDVLSGEIQKENFPEGRVLPDTYLVTRDTSREALLTRMEVDFEKVAQSAWQNRAPNLPVDTLEEAIILASIVEKETGLAEERPRVAAVFVNRMRRGMQLQSDPTIIYGVCLVHPDRCVDGRLVGADGLQRGIRRSEIDMDTGYNTYVIPSLPPTPICNPGKEALEAVLNPPTSKELYFVADGTGGHAFAETLAQHNRNVAAWRRLERSGRRN